MWSQVQKAPISTRPIPNLKRVRRIYIVVTAYQNSTHLPRLRFTAHMCSQYHLTINSTEASTTKTTEGCVVQCIGPFQ